MRSEPMINVADVEASSAWYQRLLGAKSGHGGSHFEMLLHDDQLMLMLHAADAEEHHPHQEADGPLGKGVVLYFRVGGELPEAVERAKAMEAQILQGPLMNELAHQEELWVRDPDGYTLVLCGPADWAR
jgi:catechol 2,3-dioxygenase-like lactoylglutathione lyase family enzyme